MAKKKETTKVEEPVVNEEVVIKEPSVVKEQPKVEAPKTKAKPSDTWEIKDRIYYLKGRRKPLSYMLKSAGIFYFDESLGYERELKYCENQRTSFVDEMKGDQRLEHIIFRSGNLVVPKNKTVLQKLLSLYHPHRDKVYYEWKPEVKAADEIETLELQADAILMARTMDIDLAEAIMRAEKGSEVSDLSSKELKRDLLLFARNNPQLFLELANDDNVQLRNFGIKAVEAGVISISSDQRHFLWSSNNRKIMTVPFDEHPYTALAHWFKTDEGMEIYSNIEKRLN
jgi:hypothetical protein|tara:strand:- start:30 stop:881 length:852 start_codon:yes stop_codon:yes gene_type:complete